MPLINRWSNGTGGTSTITVYSGTITVTSSKTASTPVSIDTGVVLKKNDILVISPYNIDNLGSPAYTTSDISVAFPIGAYGILGGDGRTVYLKGTSTLYLPDAGMYTCSSINVSDNNVFTANYTGTTVNWVTLPLFYQSITCRYRWVLYSHG